MLNTAIKQSEQYLRNKYRQMVFIRAKYFQDYIFIHINKTGGTSVEKALGLPLIHKTAREYKNQIGEARWQERFSFAFVRNPWDKVASQFHYRVMINETQLGKKPVKFEDWIKLVFIDQHPDYYNDKNMFAPQMDWLTDYNDEIIVDVVGRFENFQDDWQLICEKINRKGLELPHVKKSKRTDYRSYYNTQSIETIGQWFAKDIERFGYEFI